MNNLSLSALLSLFTSIGTLLCCALPALLVALGFGSVLASFISIAPWITTLSAYKIPLFLAAGLFLCVTATLLWIGRHAACPADPAQARACQTLRRLSLFSFFTALALYGIGGFFVFFAAALFYP